MSLKNYYPCTLKSRCVGGEGWGWVKFNPTIHDEEEGDEWERGRAKMRMQIMVGFPDTRCMIQTHQTRKLRCQRLILLRHSTVYDTYSPIALCRDSDSLRMTRQQKGKVDPRLHVNIHLPWFITLCKFQ